MNEIPCNPIPSADVPGYRFTRDQNGTVIAVVCRISFVVREDNAADVGRMMLLHQLHVCKPR